MTKAGKPHRGVYHAYVRVSTEKQDLDRQQHIIKEYLNGGDYTLKWYIDEGFSGSLDPEERPALKQCLSDAFKNKRKGGKGTIIISDTSRFARKRYMAEKFFVEQMSKGKCSLIVAEQPLLEEVPDDIKMKLLLDKADSDQKFREEISLKTKQALEAIKSEINTKGFKLSKLGKKITKLGVHSEMEKARDLATEKTISKADSFAHYWYPEIQDRIRRNMTYREIAEDFNYRGKKTMKGGEWHASTISNIVKRINK